VTNPEGPPPGNVKVVPMLRRIGEVIRTIFRLVESVDQLKAKNEALTARMEELRRELDRQAAQVSVLMLFVRDALNSKADNEADRRVALPDPKRRLKSRTKKK
jgi:uncharacterized protein YhaN